MIVVKQLLEFGWSPNILDKDKFSALGLSIRENHDKITSYLLDWDRVDLNTGAGNLGSPLHIAVVNLKIDIILKMVNAGADVNWKENEGNTPLHQLISIYSKNELDSFKILKILLKHNANPNALNNNGLTPLLLAISKKQKGAVRDILKANRIFKIPGYQQFDLDYIEDNTQYNSILMLLKNRMPDLAEKIFMEGGNACIPIPHNWKQKEFSMDGFIIKYMLRKMQKFQINKKFNVKPYTTLTAPPDELTRNRIDSDEFGFHSVGQLIKKRRVTKHGFIKKMIRDRESRKTSFF